MLTRLFLLLIFMVLPISSFSQDERLYLAEAIPSDLKVSSNAVIRLNQYDVIINAQNKMEIHFKRIITVLNELGNQNVMAIVGYDKNRKIKKIQSVIYDENGTEIKKFRKSDFIDHSAVDGGTLYSDSRVLYMSYTPISYPYTVEFTFQMDTPNTAIIPSWSPVEDYFLSIENNHYTITDHGNLGLRYKESNFLGFEISNEIKENSLKYKIQNVKAIRPEEYAPNLNQFTPKVMVAVEKFHYEGFDGQAKNWNEFGTWMHHSLINGRDVITQKTKDKILEITKVVDDPIEKAKLVYDFVQNNTRYISVQVGIGGIQPISALEVDQLKYGDCKGLTNYTQALLSSVGIQSYYAIVQAGRDIEDFDPEFASLEQGNHIILGIPDNERLVWLDCTSQVHPFGFIGDFTDNRNVLLVSPNESYIAKTTLYDDSENHQMTIADIFLEKEGNMVADITISTKGIQYDNRFFIESASHDEIIKYYKKSWSYINDFGLENYSFSNNKDIIEFKEELKIRANSYATLNGDRLIFSPNSFNRNTYVPERYRNRQLPLTIQRGYFDEDKFVYHLPENYSIEAIPEDVQIINKFGEYHLHIEVEDEKIIFSKKLLIKSGNYDTADYEFYRDFRKNIAKHESSIIVLKKTI